MSLKIMMPSAARAEPTALQRVAAVLGLTGLVLAWALFLIPCALWLLVSFVIKRPAAAQQRA